MDIDELMVCAQGVEFWDLDTIERLARGAVVMTPHRSGASRSGSRLGGLPDLPVSVAWPKWKERSLAFIAQIDLDAQPEVIAQQGFPRRGLLLFFYDTAQSTWGFDPKDAGSSAVIYVPEPKGQAFVTDWPSDLPKEARYIPCGLRPEETITLPPWEGVLIDDLDLNPEQLRAYLDLLSMTYEGEVWSRRMILGGYPDQMQNDMMKQCAMVTAGLYCGDGTSYQDPRAPAARSHAYEWRLLLQVPSADQAGMMWGDVGCLYYWIRDEDLKARRFDRCWMILQCG
ncbi:MAG TPA: YwqG family protein [Phycisphaerae bacterium]|nr:YwqG family protein [Phycisphaerae bacterium]